MKQHGVVQASVFGSRARGDYKPGSDLDILVDLPEGKSLLDLVALKLDLEDATGLQVDVVTREALHPRMRESVERERITVL